MAGSSGSGVDEECRETKYCFLADLIGNLRRQGGDIVKEGKWRIRIKYNTNGKEIKVPLWKREAGKQAEYAKGREGTGGPTTKQ